MMFAFFMGDASMVACGLAWESEKNNWTRVQCISIVDLYKSTTVVEIVKNWNMSTQKWIKYYVYIRQLPTDKNKS